MNGFTYHDIFATKGIEYIIVIFFLLMLIPFWMFVNKPKSLATMAQKSVGVLNAALLCIPKGVFFSKNHTWAFLNKSGIADIGIDDWLMHLTGQVTFNHVKLPGDFVKKGERISDILSGGKVLSIFSPISGKIVETNSTVNNEKAFSAGDIYSKAWFYKLEPSNWKEDTQRFYFGEEAKNWIENELLRLKDFVASELAINSPLKPDMAMQEGGELRDHLLVELPKEIWDNFQIEFLSNEY